MRLGLASAVIDIRKPSAHVLVISGSMGAGKTTVLGEASDLLCERQIVHAAIDLDGLGVVLLPDDRAKALHHQNLAAIYANCRAAGIDRFLIASAIETADERRNLQQLFADATLTICRLTASTDTMTARLRTREVGFRREEYFRRVAILDRILTASGVEDFQIANESRNVTDVAAELLARANWIIVE